MSFQNELNEIQEFFYISLARYRMSNQFMEFVQEKHPESSDEKAFYFGEKPPTENPINYDFKTNIGSFKSLLKKHEKILIENCIILLVSLWEIYCSKNGIDKYNDANISEVVLYRNCIIHNKGTIDSEYIKNSKLKKYQIGDVLDFSKDDFKIFLGYFDNK